jgi:hypothetical protein
VPETCRPCRKGTPSAGFWSFRSFMPFFYFVSDPVVRKLPVSARLPVRRIENGIFNNSIWHWPAILSAHEQVSTGSARSQNTLHANRPERTSWELRVATRRVLVKPDVSAGSRDICTGGRGQHGDILPLEGVGRRRAPLTVCPRGPGHFRGNVQRSRFGTGAVRTPPCSSLPCLSPAAPACRSACGPLR